MTYKEAGYRVVQEIEYLLFALLWLEEKDGHSENFLSSSKAACRRTIARTAFSVSNFCDSRQKQHPYKRNSC